MDHRIGDFINATYYIVPQIETEEKILLHRPFFKSEIFGLIAPQNFVT